MKYLALTLAFLLSNLTLVEALTVTTTAAQDAALQAVATARGTTPEAVVQAMIQSLIERVRRTRRIADMQKFRKAVEDGDAGAAAALDAVIKALP